MCCISIYGIIEVPGGPERQPVCIDNSIRLVGGVDQYTGKVEICEGGLYTAVCDQSGFFRNADVVCREIFGEGKGTCI